MLASSKSRRAVRKALNKRDLNLMKNFNRKENNQRLAGAEERLLVDVEIKLIKKYFAS
jgi:hypothetical protein